MASEPQETLMQQPVSELGRAAQARGVADLWRELWAHLSPRDRRLLAVAAVVMVLACALTAVLPVLIGQLVDRVLKGNAVSLGGAAGPLAIIAGLVIVAQILEVVRRQLVEVVATGFERDIRHMTYGHMLRMDLDHIRHGKVGAIYGRLNRSIEGVVKLLKLGGMDLLPAMTLAIAAIVVAFTRNPLVAAAMAGVIPTGFVLVRWQVANQTGVRVELRDDKDEIDGQVNELLPVLAVVRTTGSDDYFAEAIRGACARLRDTELRHHRAMSLFDAVKAINEGLWLLVTLAVAIQLAASGAVSAGQVTAYVLLYASVITPLRQLHRIIDEASESAQQATDLFSFLAMPEDESYGISDSARAPLTVADAPLLSLASVCFTHRGQDVPTLRGINLRVEAGERVGIVGGTACGKSTMLKVVARLHHGHEGAIRLEGRDIREFPRCDLTAMLGYVPQDPKLFKGTVLQNILLGHADADMDEVVRAAQRAQIHEEILRMPAGYQTIVGERGDTLSGGQKQRLCLARALVRTPPLLLLDEPTSALDGPSQAGVQRAIDSLTDVTMLIVAHRMSTLRTLDRIVVVGGGRIVEEGPFETLSASGSAFAAMLAAEVAEKDADVA
jgi:ATP-binding cassette, subfamily B, bacterial